MGNFPRYATDCIILYALIVHTAADRRVPSACDVCYCDGSGSCRPDLCRYRGIQCAWITTTRTMPWEELFQFPNVVAPISVEDKLRIIQFSIRLLRDVHPHRYLHLEHLRYAPIPHLEALVHRHFDTALEFHLAVREIYYHMRDFHTEYFLPAPIGRLLLLLAVELTDYDDDDRHGNSPRITIFTAQKEFTSLVSAEVLAVDRYSRRDRMKPETEADLREFVGEYAK